MTDPIDTLIDSLHAPDASELIQEAHGAMTSALVFMATHLVCLTSDDVQATEEISDLAASLTDLVAAKRLVDRDSSLCISWQQTDGQFYLCHRPVGHDNDHESRGHVW